MSETDCSNGYANRFLWIAVRRSKVLPDGGSEIDLAPMRARLSQALDRIAGEMTRSPAARDLWHRLYPDLTADRPSLWGKVTSRGEAQTLRLSMIYAALDGSLTIDVPHLLAGFAVWQYAEASARMIFPETEAMEPLEKAILEKITASPGINRKMLHKALGGHVPAAAMVQALGKLAVRGKVRSEMIPTAGRPGECWWLVLTPPTMPLIVASTTDSPSASGANERTNEVGEEPPQPVLDSSFARSEQVAQVVPAISPITLAALFARVREMDGKIVRSADGNFIVRGMEGSQLTPDILAALVDHQSDLDLIVPASPPSLEVEVEVEPVDVQRNEAVPECPARETEVQNGKMSHEDFLRELAAI